MSGRPRAVVVHNRVAPGAAPDEADVLVQAAAVRQALEAAGYRCESLAVDASLGSLTSLLAGERPAVVFNLVESLGGSDLLAALVPSALERAGQPFTGAPSAAMFLAGHKPTAKTWLRAHGVPTPDWWADAAAVPAGARCIVKSAGQQASLGLDDGCVVTGPAAAGRRSEACRARFGGDWFAEAFVDGREVNVSLLAGPGGPVVLPLAEIDFHDFPPGLARVVGYRAKWEEASFEYAHTPRAFLDEAAEGELCARLRAIALRCWEIFGLRGYARVDLRVDGRGRPWVLEANANPCLAPDAGFAAALARAGIGFDAAVARIVADARPVGGPA